MQLSYDEHDADMIMIWKTDTWTISNQGTNMAHHHDFNEEEDCNYDEHDVEVIMTCKTDAWAISNQSTTLLAIDNEIFGTQWWTPSWLASVLSLKFFLSVHRISVPSPTSKPTKRVKNASSLLSVSTAVPSACRTLPITQLCS